MEPTPICLTVASYLLAAGGYCAAQTMRVPIHRPGGDPKLGASLPSAVSGKNCWLFPTRYDCMNYGAGAAANINAFYGMAGPASFFDQIKSIYNGASGAATVSADLATLNFTSGMQVTAGTNVQAGPWSAATVSSGVMPTLGSTAAAQAAQNMLYGGTAFASALYPILAVGADRLGSAGGFGMVADGIARAGIDLQNFTAGSNVSVNSPPSHSSAQVEGYLQYNSTDLASDSSDFAGAIFLGGSYGYSYTSHDYAREYGFGDQVSNGLGQISAGILINGVARITVSRAFGPSQTYIDSATTLRTTVNNFKAWSVGITYQAPAPK